MKKLVGLTGKTGAGKSTISEYLSKKGAYVIDGDIIARVVLEKDKTLLPSLCDAFGDILFEDGTLDRKKLALKAFSTPENTKLLNSIMHPAINKLIHKESEKAFLSHEVVVVDAAAIIESGFADECDLLIVVQAPVSVRMERIMKRDNITKEDALVRINGQKEDSFYTSKADFVVNNYEPFITADELSIAEKEIFGA